MKWMEKNMQNEDVTSSLYLLEVKMGFETTTFKVIKK
jgi:hypothetical protein